LWRPEQICQDRHFIDITVVTARLFEQDGRAFRAQQAVADLGHFQVGRHRCGHAPEVAALFQLTDEIAQIFVLHSEFGSWDVASRQSRARCADVCDDTHAISKSQKNRANGRSEIVSN